MARLHPHRTTISFYLSQKLLSQKWAAKTFQPLPISFSFPVSSKDNKSTQPNIAGVSFERGLFVRQEPFQSAIKSAKTKPFSQG
jgi:hypothetical protein